MDQGDNAAAAPPPYPAVAALLRHARAWAVGPALGVLLLVVWLAWRTGWVELAGVAPVAAGVLYFVLRVAIDVVTLVADMLMPR